MSNIRISQDILNRSILVREFNENEIEINDGSDASSLINTYAPRVLIDLNLAWRLPTDHLATDTYRKSMNVPANQIPVFTAPPLNKYFPARNPNYIEQPRNTSILPLLIAAQSAKVDFHNYDVVGERNSFRKIGDNTGEYAIGVMRDRNTILLRRYDRRSINTNDAGFLFEQMCTPNYGPDFNYKHLVEGHIGSLKTLMTAEIDAVVSEENKESIELTCRQQVVNALNKKTWLQLFLGGTKTLTVGYRSNDEPPQLLDLQSYEAPEIINQQNQLSVLQHIYQVLLFLRDNVEEGRSYLLRHHCRNEAATNMGLFLYEVTDRNDILSLQFIKPWILKQLAVNNNNQEVQQGNAQPTQEL